MKTLFLVFGSFFLAISLFACGGQEQGGSEFGNPSRVVMGTVDSQGTETALVTKKATNGCLADQMIATDSKAQTTTATIEEDCSFEITLSVGKAYAVSFTSGDVFVATLIVNNSPKTLNSSVFIISDGETSINLGRITFTDNKAIPENQPAAQNDQDDDGTYDFDDEDDDGDGTVDEWEEDCDYDDYEDDFDEEDSCDVDVEEDEELFGIVIDVIPNDEEEFVWLEEDIEVSFDCEVDEESVSNDSFRVESEEDVIDCDFSFSESDYVVTCRHEEQEFLPSTMYTATLEGIFCLDNTEVESVTWSWTTEEDFEDSGDEEDLEEEDTSGEDDEEGES